MLELLVGFVVRLAQVVIEAAPTLVIGVFTAGIFRRMVGPAGTRRLFGTGIRGLLTGWLAGKLLPICSLGVIPVARELRRSGVPGGTVLAFVLAAPLLNPLSLLYGITLAKPVVILSFGGCSLLLSTLAGLLWDRVFARTSDAAESARLAAIADTEPLPPPGPKRLLAVLVSAVKDLTGRDLIFYAIGLVASALLSTAIPFGSLQRSMMPADWSSPLLMAAIAVPIFSSPLQGMMKIGMMFGHGNSIGAALVLFLLGVGTCGGTMAWLLTTFDRRRVLPWLLTYLVVVVGLGYGCQWLLTDPDRKPEDHTHAFDEYTCPFPAGSGSDVYSVGYLKVAEKFGPFDAPPLYVLGTLILIGLVVRRWDRSGCIERWLTASGTATKSTRPKWDVNVPPVVVGAVAILGLLAFSVVGAYAYYPDRKTTTDDMVREKTEAQVMVNTGRDKDASRHLEELDLLSRKLEVGVFLRTGRTTPEQAAAADRFRTTAEEVRDALRDGEKEKAKRLFQLHPDERRLRDAVRAGDLDEARRVVAEVDRRRARQMFESHEPMAVVVGTAGMCGQVKVWKRFTDELGSVWAAIERDDREGAKAALDEAGVGGDTLIEAYEALRQAFAQE